MKRIIIFLFYIFSILSICSLYAVETISLEIQMITPENRDTRNLLSDVLIKSASRASRIYDKYISVEQKKDLSGTADYQLQIMAVLNDESPVLVATFTKESSGESLSQSLMGEITEDSHLYLSEVIFKLWAEMNPRRIESHAQLPEYLEEIPSRYIIESAIPDFTGYNTASAVAVKENGNIILAMGALCYELTPDFNIVSQIGADQFNQTSTLFVFGAAVTPGGTVYLKPTSGREIYRVIDGASRSMRVRTGIDVTGPMAVLNNGVTILYHTMTRKFVRIEGNKRSNIDLNLGPYTYVYAMAAGPEGNLWIHDSMEQRFKIYSDDGTFIDSIIPVGLKGETLSPLSMTVSSDGSVILYSSGALYKFDREGILQWKMGGYQFRDYETFPITPLNLAVDPVRGFIYMTDYASNRVLKFYDPGLNQSSPDDKTRKIIDLNRKIDSTPGSSDLLWEKAEYYLQNESWVLAKMWLEEIVNENPFDSKADALLVQMEMNSLMNQVENLKSETFEIIESLGPESARQKYSQTVQLYEKILSLNPGQQDVINDLNRFRESYNRDAAVPGSRQKPLTIASINMGNIFPSLIHFYVKNPLGKVTVKNDLDIPVRNIRAELSLRQFIDYPKQSKPIESLSPGEEAEIDLHILLNEKAFNLQEDLPVLAQINISYEISGDQQIVSETTNATLYRRTALSWDDTAKLAAFIMPNEGVVSTFSHRVLEADREENGLPPKMIDAARICDALGTYGITYVEDPDSPFSQILGKEQHVDTVRYPRTTLHIQSGDCDDTTALLTSLLESAGISTAIMTSPGHVFLAFDTEEPVSNKWMFETGIMRVIESDGTIWIPVESTLLSEGFYRSWSSASAIINKTPEGDIEFITVKDQRETFPPLPLSESNMIIIEPGREQIDPLFHRSLESLRESLYDSSISALESLIKESRDRRQRQLNNKLGILHARFQEFRKAEDIFKKLIRENDDYLSPYMNLGHLYYYSMDFDRALSTFQEAQKLKPDSVMVNLALAKTYHRLDDSANTVRFFSIVQSRSESLSDQYAYLVNDNVSARAGIDGEPPISWNVEED
ncbi:MAG: hypothetical protein JEY91_02405 [Spirochaetaceae bacterium]|nr:hypothetical protein [Spirochaetaceae bacterium]